MILKRCFPYEKSIVTNALYDTIEKVGLILDSADSTRGTLVISDRRLAGKMRVELRAAVDGEETAVSIFPQGKGGNAYDKWGRLVLGELDKTIEQARRRHRGPPAR